jgi:hypothetical protein
MTALSPILCGIADNHVGFWCPGCNRSHVLRVGGEQTPRWTYNGNPDAPTFTPSILARFHRPSGTDVCHSFVTDGMIQFLSDCTHELAGQTVPIPEWRE